MSRSFCLIGLCALALAVCPPGRAQDSSSLGDLARKAQKNKPSKPPAKVFTNDDIASSPRASSTPGAAPSAAPQLGPLGRSGEVQSAPQGLEKLRETIDLLDSLDRPTLVSNVLDGNTTNFPGRAQWEQKVFAAKQVFVSQARGVLQQASQLAATAETMKDIQDPNDPRVKSFSAKLQQLVQDSQRESAAFQAVVMEGKDLAGLPAAH